MLMRQGEGVHLGRRWAQKMSAERVSPHGRVTGLRAADQEGECRPGVTWRQVDEHTGGHQRIEMYVPPQVLLLGMQHQFERGTAAQ